MKKVGLGTGFALLLGFSVYWCLRGEDYVLRIPEAELQDKLAHKFPFSKTYFFVFEVTFKNPRVQLVAGSDRMNAGLDVQLTRIMGQARNSLGTTLDVAGQLNYVPLSGEFFMVNPEILHFELQGLAPEYQEQAQLAVIKALEEFMRTRPVYTLNPSDGKKALTRMLLKTVEVENSELVITLGL